MLQAPVKPGPEWWGEVSKKPISRGASGSAGLYPRDVAALVLIDPVPEDFYSRAAGLMADRYSSEEETYLQDLYADSTRLAEQLEGAAYLSSTEQARASDQ